MTIKNISIISFGMIRNRTIDFADGLNVIEGDNETGKSTVGAFIKFIFYGLNKAEKAKYVGWGEAGCSGSLTLVSGGETYRIERELVLSRTNDKINVIPSGSVPMKTDKTPAELFLKVPEQVFVNTAFTGQLGSAINGSGLPEAAENILFSADEAVNTVKALKKLDEARVMLLHKNKKGGKVYELENAAAELEYKLASAKSAAEQIFTLDDSIRTMRARYNANREKAALIIDQLDEYDAYTRLQAVAAHNENKAELAKKEQTVKELEEKYRHDGFLPDAAYVDLLRTLRAEETELSAEAAENAREIADAEAEVRADGTGGLLKLSAGVGGIDGIRSIYSGFVKKSASFRIGAVLVLLALIISVGAGVAFYMMDMIMPHLIICGAAAAAFIILAVVMFTKISRISSGLQKLSAKLGAEDHRQIPGMLDEAEKRSGELHEKTGRLNAAYERQKKLKEKSEALVMKIKEAISKRKETSATSLSDLISETEKIVTELSVARSELEMAQYKARVSAEKAEGADEKQLRAKIKGALPAEECKTFKVDMKRTELNWLTKQNESLTEKLTEAEKSLAAANATFTLPAQIYAKLIDVRAELEEAREDYEAHVLAYEKLSEASRRLRSSISPALADYAGKLMDGFTGGKYGELGVSDSFDITYSGEGMTHPADTLSSGTQDMAYVSLRLALVKLLFPDKTTVFFDDTFARVDNGRLIRVMKTLSTLENQCVLFTCRDREGKCAEIFGGRVIKI